MRLTLHGATYAHRHLIKKVGGYWDKARQVWTIHQNAWNTIADKCHGVFAIEIRKAFKGLTTMNGESAMNDNQTAWQEYDKLGHEIDMLENKRGDLLGSLIPRLKDIAYHLGFQFDRIIGLRDSTISGALTMTCLIYGCRGGSDEESEHTFPGVYLFMTAEEFDKKVAQDNKVKSSNLKNAKLREIEAIEERLTKAKKELERIG